MYVQIQRILFDLYSHSDAFSYLEVDNAKKYAGRWLDYIIYTNWFS